MLTLVESAFLTDAVVARGVDGLQDGADGDDGVRPVTHVHDPLRLAGEREDIVDRHDAEVDGHGDTVHDVGYRRSADLERRQLFKGP